MALTVAQLVARVTADTSGFYRGMAVANSSMLRTGGIIGRVAAGAGLATLGMGIMSLRAAGNFEEAMNILEAVAEPTKKQFQDLQDEAIALGADLKLPNVSAKDAANAMQELAKGGLNVDQILGATRGTLQLGLAANTDFANSAVIVARALKAFSLQGEDAVDVADLFAAAANKSTAEMTDVALGFQMASAQFAAGDQTIQSLTTSLAIMADAGIIGSDAGTSLKTMMNRLMAPTKKAKGLMDELSFAVYDTSGNMKTIPALIGDLTSSLMGMSKEQQNAALYTIFGSDAIRAARVLLKEGEGGWLAYQKSITKGGEAQRITEARTKGLNGAMQAFGSAVETQAILLGTAMLPAATAVTRAMTKFVMAIDVDKIIGFFSAIKDGVVWFKDFVAQSDVAQYVLAGLAGAFVGLLVAQKVIAMFKAIQVAWMLLNASFLLSPIGLIVVAIAALIGALVLAYFKVEKFREIVDNSFNWILTNVPPMIQQVVDFLKTTWGRMKDDVIVALKFIRAYWENTWGRLLNFIIQNWGKISDVLEAVFGHMMIQVRGALKTIEGVINLVMGIIHGDWGRAWEGIKQILDGTLGTMLALLKSTLTRIIPAVLSLAIAAGKAILSGIGRGIANLASWVGGKIKAGVSAAVSGLIGWVTSTAQSIGQAIVDGILSGVTGLPGALKDKLVGGISSAFGAATGFLRSGSPSQLAAEKIGKPIADGVILGWLTGSADLPAKITESLRRALEAGKNTVDGYKDNLAQAFANLADDAFRAFDAQTEAFLTKAEQRLAAFDTKQTKKEMAAEMKELRDNLKEEQDKLAAIKPEQLTQREGETADEFAQRAAEGQDAYIDALNAQKARVAEAEKAIEDELEQRRIARQRERLAKEAERSRAEYEEKRRIQRRRLQDDIADLEEFLLKHPQKHRLIQKRILALFASYGIRYRNAGHSLGKLYARGIADSVSEIRKAANELAVAIENLLKLSSPAKKGPLSTLDKWWEPFGKTLVSGLDTNAITSAATMMAGPPRGRAGGVGAFTGKGASTRTTVSEVHYHYHVAGSLIAEKDLDSRIRDGIQRERLIGREA